MKNNIFKIGSLATKLNVWRKEPGRFKFFNFPFKIDIMLILFVKIKKL